MAARSRFDPDRIRGALEGVAPEPLGDHAVQVGDRRYPPEQVLALVTGLERRRFSGRHARWVLQQAGLRVVRLPQAPGTPEEQPAHDEHRGKWVAVRNGQVLFAADTPQLVAAWLADSGERRARIILLP